MEDDCWSILALENVNSLAASIALKTSGTWHAFPLGSSGRGEVRTRGQTRQMRQRASSRTTAVGRPQLTPGIHQTRSHDCAWYTCRSRCWSEFIKNFGIGFCRRAAHTPSLGDLTPLHVGPLQKETAPARGRAEAVGALRVCRIGQELAHPHNGPALQIVPKTKPPQHV